MTRTIPNYAVVLEQGENPNSFGAYVPDLPGCVAVGSTRAEVRTLIRGAIRMHLDSMLEDGVPIPKPTTIAYGIGAKRVAANAARKSAGKPTSRGAVGKVALGSKNR